VHRVYLNELGDIRQLPVGIALMLLTLTSEDQAASKAQYLITRAQQTITDPMLSQFIIELVVSIMVYKFTHLTRLEVETMLGLNLSETRFYLDVRTEEAMSLILRLLTRRLRQELPDELRSQISALPLPLLEELGEALLDFTALTDLEQWLAAHPPQESTNPPLQPPA